MDILFTKELIKCTTGLDVSVIKRDRNELMNILGESISSLITASKAEKTVDHLINSISCGTVYEVSAMLGMCYTAFIDRNDDFVLIGIRLDIERIFNIDRTLFRLAHALAVLIRIAEIAQLNNEINIGLPAGCQEFFQPFLTVVNDIYMKIGKHAEFYRALFHIDSLRTISPIRVIIKDRIPRVNLELEAYSHRICGIFAE